MKLSKFIKGLITLQNLVGDLEIEFWGDEGELFDIHPDKEYEEEFGADSDSYLGINRDENKIVINIKEI